MHSAFERSRSGLDEDLNRIGRPAANFESRVVDAHAALAYIIDIEVRTQTRDKLHPAIGNTRDREAATRFDVPRYVRAQTPQRIPRYKRHPDSVCGSADSINRYDTVHWHPGTDSQGDAGNVLVADIDNGAGDRRSARGVTE